MIKKVLFFLSFVFAVVACNKQPQEFNISGTISGLYEDEMVYLYDNSVRAEVDSVVVVDGNFSFKGSVEEPTLFYVIIRRDGGEVSYKSFWVENSEITINGDVATLDKAVVEGSTIQKQQNQYDEQVVYLAVQFDSLYALYNPNDAELTVVLEKQIDSLMEVENQEKIKFIMANPDYVLSAYIAKRLVRNIAPEEGIEIYNALSEEQQLSKYGQAAKEFLDLNKNLSVGDMYVDLSLPNKEGETIKLSSLEGKYVLIDFWASWCKPCRRESPYLKEAYAKYNEKGFEIYAVSLDNDANKWIEAIAEDDMTWSTVLADGAFDSKSAMIYGVKYIPFNYLIGPDGKIIKMHLRGDGLLKDLEELLAE